MSFSTTWYIKHAAATRCPVHRAINQSKGSLGNIIDWRLQGEKGAGGLIHGFPQPSPKLVGPLDPNKLAHLFLKLLMHYSALQYISAFPVNNHMVCTLHNAHVTYRCSPARTPRPRPIAATGGALDRHLAAGRLYKYTFQQYSRHSDRLRSPCVRPLSCFNCTARRLGQDNAV